MYTRQLGRQLLGVPSTNDSTNLAFPDAGTIERTSNSTSGNCTRAAILEFPFDGFTREQRQTGWVVLHVVIACYCFWLLAIVCDDYFVDAVKGMCSSKLIFVSFINYIEYVLKMFKAMRMKEDVVGATFMAAATSSPELFINCIGTFVTKGDLGVGTVVGSAVFNILAVPACCGLFGGQVNALTINNKNITSIKAICRLSIWIGGP